MSGGERVTRDVRFPPAGVGYRFDHPLRFSRTLGVAAADVEATWVAERGRTVKFEPRDARRLAFGQFIFFAPGSYDNWAVWVGRVDEDGETRVAMVEDGYYFEILRRLGLAYGYRRVFGDVSALYRATAWHRAVRDDVVALVAAAASRYESYDDRCWMYNALMHVYYGMLAEENKSFAPMGRRAKVHGLYRLLVLGDSVDAAVCCSEGRPWRVVDAEVQSWGVVPDDARQVMSPAEREALLRGGRDELGRD